MSVRNVCKYPATVLREPTEPVAVFDDELGALIRDMWDTMYAADGIGLAAPQIGVSRKVIVIDYKGERFVLINPEITERDNITTVEEGCLSFPGIYENVEAPEHIRALWLDENGEKHERVIDGFLACVFSHETDHLNGRLLIDRVSPLKRQFLKRKIAKGTKS